MKRILILYLVSVWFCIADAEIRFNPLNVERIEGVVGVTHDELRDAISSKNPAFSNAVNETVATKADKPVHSVEDNLASITADGNLKDSGIAKTNVATKAELTHKLNDGGEVKIERSIDGNPPSLDIGNPGSLASWLSAHPFSWHIGYRGVNEAGSHLYGTFDKAYYLINKTADYEPTDKDEIAVKGDISALNAHVENTSNPHAVTAEQVEAVPLVEDKNGNKTAVTIGNRLVGIVGPGSLAHGVDVYAEGNGSYASGYGAYAVGNYSRADGNRTQAISDGSYASGIMASTRPEDAYSFAWNGNGDSNYGVYYSHGVGTFNVNPIGGLDGFYIGDDKLSSIMSKKADKLIPSDAGNLAALTDDGNLADSGKRVGELATVTNPVPFMLSINNGLIPYFSIKDQNGQKLFNIGPAGDFVFGGYNMVLSSGKALKIHYRAAGDDETDANEIAVKGDISDAISATDPTFSKAVLDVGLSWDVDSVTNAVAALNDFKGAFGGLDASDLTGGAATLGSLLLAIIGAVTWLKKNKVGSFASVGGASATVKDGVATLSDFFTESNSLLTGTIDARLPYPLNAVTDETGLLKDRAINTTSLASVTVPDNFTDLLVRASVETSLAVTMPEAIATKYGDTFPGEAGEYLITITKTGAAEAYVRTIKLEEVA